MINALRKKYEAEIEAAKANIDVYIKNPVGIGEHPDLVAAMDTEMTKLADASDKLAQNAIRATKFTAAIQLVSGLQSTIQIFIAPNIGVEEYYPLFPTLELFVSMLSALIMSGWIGPRLWAHSMDEAFEQLAELSGYTEWSATRHKPY